MGGSVASRMTFRVLGGGFLFQQSRYSGVQREKDPGSLAHGYTACSTAFYGKRKFGEPENTCSWCHRQVVADWHHLAWCCSGILMNNQRPPIPMASESRALRIASQDWRAEDAAPSLSVSDSLRNLRGSWRTIWVRQGCDHAAAVARWRLFGRRARFSGCASPLLSPEALQHAAQHKDHGAAGPDGWSGCEISSWPRDAWNVYAQLLNRWMKRASFPSSWRQLRQVHTPKDSCAPNAAQQVKADELRPIAVLSVLWRVVSSAIARHAHTQERVNSVVESGKYGGIHARHLHQKLGQLATPFQSGAVLTALDLQKCFDFVEPGLACAVLREADFPSPFLAGFETCVDSGALP